MHLLNGREIALKETLNLKEKVSSLKNKPTFAIIQVGNLPESNKYINNKLKKANEIGIYSKCFKFDKSISEIELIKQINKIQDNYDGLIVQLPLPNHINSQNVLDSIKLDKDIDGLSTKNMENFYNDKFPYYCPATARAIHLMLDYYNINLNQKIMIIGESNLVGKPIKHLLSKFTNEITSRNKKTGITGSENYDILIVATGNKNLIKKENVKNEAIIVDVGITILNNKKIVGDVDFEDVKHKVSYISPVPGGVGPLTVICLFKNLLDKF